MYSSLMAVFLLITTVSTQTSPGQVSHGRVYLFSSSLGQQPGHLVGVIDFFQSSSGVNMNGSINGLTPGQHGFHVHEKGDLSNGCLGAGGHWNPLKKNHGAPTATERHHGDLGNVVTPASGVTQVNVRDSLLTLNGPYSIVGRAVVVHEKADDLGLGGTTASLTTGDAGARVACGVIGIA